IAPPVRPPYRPGRDLYWGDLASAMGIPFRFREPDYLPLKTVVGNPGSLGLRAKLVTPDDDRFKIYQHPDASLPRLLMNRDSMAIWLMPMLAENFHWSVFMLSSTLNRRVIDREHPDIVIDEIVERGALTLAHNRIKF